MKKLTYISWTLFILVTFICIFSGAFTIGHNPGGWFPYPHEIVLMIFSLVAFPVQLIGLMIALATALSRGETRWIYSNVYLLLCNIALVWFVASTQ
jgi:hypothetical protein